MLTFHGDLKSAKRVPQGFGFCLRGINLSLNLRPKHRILARHFLTFMLTVEEEVREDFGFLHLDGVCLVHPDVTILHAQQVDARGNVLVRGILGATREAALAARSVLFTVEEQVEKLDAPMNATVIPHWVVTAASVVKGGAWPSYAQGHYPRDNAFYQQWDEIARERESFRAWMEHHVLGTADHRAFLQRLGEGRAA